MTLTPEQLNSIAEAENGLTLHDLDGGAYDISLLVDAARQGIARQQEMEADNLKERLARWASSTDLEALARIEALEEQLRACEQNRRTWECKGIELQGELDITLARIEALEEKAHIASCVKATIATLEAENKRLRENAAGMEKTWKGNLETLNDQIATLQEKLDMAMGTLEKIAVNQSYDPDDNSFIAVKALSDIKVKG